MLTVIFLCYLTQNTHRNRSMDWKFGRSARDSTPIFSFPPAFERNGGGTNNKPGEGEGEGEEV